MNEDRQSGSYPYVDGMKPKKVLAMTGNVARRSDMAVPQNDDDTHRSIGLASAVPLGDALSIEECTF